MLYPFCRGDKKTNDSDSDEEDAEKSRLKSQLEGTVTSAMGVRAHATKYL